jgi:hypothetical protein
MRSPVCRIPWEHRRELGRLRSFWKTVWLVTFRKQRFCEEYVHTVRYSDARAFQWVTLIHLYVLAMSATVYVYLTVPAALKVPNTMQQMMMGLPAVGPTLLDRAYAEVWPVAILLVCLLLYLFAMTGVAGYFFHPRGLSAQQQNSAIAMSYYACGPLAAITPAVTMVWVVLEFFLLDAWLAGPWYSVLWIYIQQAWVLAAGITAVLLPIAWWTNLIYLARLIMPQVKGRSIAIATILPCLWLVLAGLILVTLPLVVLCVLVVIASLG